MALTVASACGGGDSSATSSAPAAAACTLAGGAFAAQVSAARATFNDELDEVLEHVNEVFASMTPDVAVRGPAEAPPKAIGSVDADVAELESPDVPDEFAADVAGLGEAKATFGL